MSESVSHEVRLAVLEERVDRLDRWRTDAAKSFEEVTALKEWRGMIDKRFEEMAESLKSINVWLRGLLASVIMALGLLILNLLFRTKF